MKYIKLFITTISLVALLSVGGAAANGLSSSAQVPVDITSSFVDDACSALTYISTKDGCADKTNTFDAVAKTVVNVLSFIIGIVGVIMLIISGFKFITAGGDSNAVASARSTLIYALVGIAIAVLAQFIVREVLNTSNSIQNSYLNSQSVIKSDG